MSFLSLVEEGRKLTNHLHPNLNVSRGLEQIEAQTNRILKRTGNQPVDQRTQFLLATKGLKL